MISRANFEYARDVASRCAGIQFAQGSEYLLESRLLAVARERRIGSVNELLRLMQSGAMPDGEQVLIETLTDKETCFFRDARPFEALKRFVLPELKTKRATDRKLSIWSVGCSTGQEPYSMALMLHEFFPELLAWQIDLVASDVSVEALRVAHGARYNQIEINRGLPVALWVKYFQKEGVTWRLNEKVSRMVSFSQLNILQEWPEAGGFDIVFLRNVMGGFDPETQAEVLARLGPRLAPDGCLLIGAKENPKGLLDTFDEVRFEKVVCYRPKPGLAAKFSAGGGSQVDLSLPPWGRLAQFASRTRPSGLTEVAKSVADEAPLQARLLKAAAREQGQGTGIAPPATAEEAMQRARRELLMVVAVTEPLIKVLAESFMAMVSIELASIEVPPEQEVWLGQVAATARFSGSLSGFLAVRLKPEPARGLAAEVLGLAMEDTAPEVVGDLMKQILNIVVDNWKTHLATAGLDWKFEPPAVVQTERKILDTPPQAARESFAYQFKSEPILVDVIIQAASPRGRT